MLDTEHGGRSYCSVQHLPHRILRLQSVLLLASKLSRSQCGLRSLCPTAFYLAGIIRRYSIATVTKFQRAPDQTLTT